MPKTRAQENRAIRQEELRAKLSAGGHLQYAIKFIDKIAKLKPSKNSSYNLNRYKTVVELQLRLVNKYLPDLKNVEIAGDGGGAITIKLIDYSVKNND